MATGASTFYPAKRMARRIGHRRSLTAAKAESGGISGATEAARLPKSRFGAARETGRIQILILPVGFGVVGRWRLELQTR